MSLSTAFLSFFAVTGLTGLLIARREARAARHTPPTGQDFEVEGGRIHLEISGSGPDLVLIHGSSGNLRDFTHALAPALAGRYRVIAVDRPGLGWSDAHPDGDTITTQARLIQQAVAAAGAERPIVVGHSYGGAVALAWAVTRPDTLSALVTLSAPSHPWETGLGWYYTVTSHPLGQMIAVPLITAFVPGWYVQREIEKVFEPQTAPPGYAAHFGTDLAVRRRNLRVNARQRRHLLEQIRALYPGYHGITVPIEIVHGTADHVVSHVIHAERFVAEHHDAGLTLLDGIGHMPHHVAQPEVIAAIDRAALRANVK